MNIYLRFKRSVAVLCLILALGATVSAQELSSQSPEKPAANASPQESTPDKATIPFQIQLLETHVRFEINGDSRKEVHTIVKLNNAVGAQEFSRLAFNYNRAYQQVEIPLVRVTHANGGTSEVLPSAITDAPNPTVEKYPAYQDVRVKSVRLLGLQEDDMIEYRVITTTTHPPLAPDFWLEHTFDRSGEVLEERYELDVPASGKVKVWTSAAAHEFEKKEAGEGAAAHQIYSWRHEGSEHPADEGEKARSSTEGSAQFLKDSDVAMTTYESWKELKRALEKLLSMETARGAELKTKAQSLTVNAKNAREKFAGIYSFVTQKIALVDLPLTATSFISRPPTEILSSGYATPEEKVVLLIALAKTIGLSAKPAFTGAHVRTSNGRVLPTIFANVLVVSWEERKKLWMDPSASVTPFAMIAVNLRGKPALVLFSDSDRQNFYRVTRELPYTAFQKVGVTATLGKDGNLTAKVKYTLRGDNELLLRVAFHQTAKEKWKDVAGLLALSDGFRGVITSATASDPLETMKPFTVEYELTQSKFVEWSKKPVRIPALLPQIGLPDTSVKSSGGNIELGTPLDVETRETLHLPEGTTVQAPAGTVVERDYATYSSKYGFTADTLTALRHIHFLQREVAADRAIDYTAFVQAVQNDQAQYFVLDRGADTKSPALQ